MIDHSLVVQNSLNNISDELRDLARLFESSGRNIPCFLYGRNAQSETLSRHIRIDGYLDDYAEDHETWHGKPVLHSDGISRDAIVVNCVLNAKPRTAFNRLKGLGISKVVSYADLCRIFPNSIPLPDFVADTRAELEQHRAAWSALYDRLADSASRKTLDDVLSFRLTGEHDYLRDYEFRPWDQYFEDFLSLNNEVFVDAGGFNGDTTEEFCRRFPDYKKVYFFEPSAKNMLEARRRLAQHRNIEFIEQGISDKPGTLWFNADAGSASAISDAGSSKIDVTTLDAATDDKVSFIKMDLEGWEMKALVGSRKHILDDHPKLAIAVYHHPSDFRRIPEFVTAIRNDYDIYLRHYTESWTETVMYFVPK